MMRLLLLVAVSLMFAAGARAHFVYLLSSEDGSSVKVVLSDELDVDDNIDAAKIAGAKLYVRGADGKSTPLKCKVCEHHLEASLPGKGPRVVYGTTDYGVLQKGDAKPFQLKYHSKAIVGDITAANSKVGDALPLEIVPEVKGIKVRLQLLVQGKPVSDAEMTVILPAGKNDKVKTDKEGFTTWFDGKGRYGAWARYFESTPGDAGGKKFEEVRHYATLVVDVVGSQYPDLPIGFSSFGAAVVDDHVYVYGGHSGRAHRYSTETTHGNLRRLNLKNASRWEELPGGPKLQGLALVAYRGKLYRIGGMQPQNSKSEKTDIRSQASFAVFDPSTKKWAELESLPEPRSSHDAAVVGDTLYVFGGWTLEGTGRGKWIEHGLSLDLSSPSAKWQKVKQPFQRRALTIAALDGKVYVMGGLSAAGGVQKAVNVFDTKTGQWTEGPTIPGEGMNGFTPASAVRDGRLYLTPRDGKLYTLNAKKSDWEVVGKLEKGRIVARMVAGPEKSLLVIAGAAPGEMLASVESVTPFAKP